MAAFVKVTSRDATWRVPLAEGSLRGGTGPWNVSWPSSYSWPCCKSEWTQIPDVVGHAGEAFIEVLPLLAQMNRGKVTIPWRMPEASRTTMGSKGSRCQGPWVGIHSLHCMSWKQPAPSDWWFSDKVEGGPETNLWPSLIWSGVDWSDYLEH